MIGISKVSDLFHKFGLQFHGAKTVYFAIDVVVAFNQTDILDFCAHFKRLGTAFYLKVLDDGNGISVI